MHMCHNITLSKFTLRKHPIYGDNTVMQCLIAMCVMLFMFLQVYLTVSMEIR